MKIGYADAANELEKLKAENTRLLELNRADHAAYTKLRAELIAERDRYRVALMEIDALLTVPAAEYVPAIGQAFDVIDRVLGKDWRLSATTAGKP